MAMRIILAIAALLLGLSVEAWLPHGISLAGCPYADQAATDGCAGAPVGSTQIANFFTSYAPLSGQSYLSSQFSVSISGGVATVSGATGTVITGHETLVNIAGDTASIPAGVYVSSFAGGSGGNGTYNLANATGVSTSGTAHALRRPPWDEVCIDYACGANNATATVDPTTSVPTGCSYRPTSGPNGGPQIYCLNTSNLVILNYDFTLHGCIQLDIVGSSTSGGIVIQNSKFAINTGCDAANQAVIVFGVGVKPASVSITSITCDGSAIPTTGHDWCIQDNSEGTALAPLTKTIDYSYFYDIPNNNGTIDPSYSTLVFKHTMANGWDLNTGLGSHGAFFQTTPATSAEVYGIEYLYDVGFIPLQPNAGTAIFAFDAKPAGFNTIDLVEVDHSLSIVNTNGSGGGTVNVALADVLHGMQYTSAIMTNDYVDRTGSNYCFLNQGDGSSITVSPAVSAQIATVTAIGSGAIYPGAAFGTSSSTYSIIQPYGTSGTSGTGLTGSYALTTSALNGLSGSNFNTYSSYAPSVTSTGNVNMKDGSAVPISGQFWASGTCN